MNIKNLFNAKEIPYKELEELFGIDKEAFLDLPKKALDRIMTGRTSPLLNLKYKDRNGMEHPVSVKFALQREKDGMVHFVFTPYQKEINNKYKLTDEELRKLKDGDTIVKNIDRGQGKEKCFIQLDEETNSLMTAKAEEVRIPNSIGDVEIGMAQQERMRNGEPVQLEVGDTTVTVGVDLNDLTGFKVLNGDLDEWRMKKLVEWDRITPGATGYWLTSENGWEYKKLQKEELEMENRREEGESETQGMGRGMKMKF